MGKKRKQKQSSIESPSLSSGPLLYYEDLGSVGAKQPIKGATPLSKFEVALTADERKKRDQRQVSRSSQMDYNDASFVTDNGYFCEILVGTVRSHHRRPSRIRGEKVMQSSGRLLKVITKTKLHSGVQALAIFPSWCFCGRMHVPYQALSPIDRLSQKRKCSTIACSIKGLCVH
jgi:hypothetical protein